MQQPLANDGASATTPIGFIIKVVQRNIFAFPSLYIIIKYILKIYIKCFPEGLMNKKFNQLHICTQ
jgi:hypothetical protein